MQTAIDYKQFAILYVDDEEKSLKNFLRSFGRHFRVLTASSALEGLQTFWDNKDEIGLIMTDQRMPGQQGVEFLEKVCESHPNVVRILVTAYSDFEAAIKAVNEGAIYKYVSKPWENAELEITLKRGLELFALRGERDQLLKEKLAAIHNTVIADRVICVGLLAAGLGHYVLNAMTPVRIFLELMPAKLKDAGIDVEQLRRSEYWTTFYENMQAQLERVSELLTDLSGIHEKLEHPFRDEVKLHHIVSEALAQMKSTLHEKQISVSSEIPEDLPPLMVDEDKFQKLFKLLLKDEATTLSPSSHISFSAQLVERPEDLGGPLIQVQVVDDGPGISEERLRSVFSPFCHRSGDPQELGINLMACYFIVYHHGGEIRVQSNNGKGTSFTFDFPIKSRSHDLMDGLERGARILSDDKVWQNMFCVP